MTPTDANHEDARAKLQQRAQSLDGTVQGHTVKFDGIHWTCTAGVELQIDTPDGEVYEEHEAEFSGTVQDDPGEHLAEVWDWVQTANTERWATVKAQDDDHAELVANRRKYGAEY